MADLWNFGICTFVIFQLYLLSQHIQELFKRRRGTRIAEQLLLRRLAKPLVHNTKLEVGDQHVLVVAGDQRGGLGAEHRREVVHGQTLVEDARHLGGRGRVADAGGGDELVHGAGAKAQ